MTISSINSDSPRFVSSVAGVSSLGSNSSMTHAQIDLEIAGWISFYGLMLNANNSDGKTLAINKLKELKAQYSGQIDDNYTAMLTKINLDNPIGLSAFNTYWVVINPDGTNGPLAQINSDLRSWKKDNATQIHTPDYDDGTYNFCVTLLMLDFAKTNTAKLSEFGEIVFGYHDSQTQFDQCYTAALEVAYYLQQLETAGSLTAADLQTIVSQVDFKPGKDQPSTQEFIAALKADYIVLQTDVSISKAAKDWDDFADDKHIWG